ncbi:polymorphic toxin-type HINT domain-containing protein [Streptomyces sp. NBC_00424]|uniref:polymorphic toxin-type HINT domain-containing protein n=1 Tax=Streptomyces sp. NBC_00424 TaxID=2903648 RepID=UPI00225B6D16|nr:polymorphic toxin-type HINT domain-containing protein [Streptomyces sp. NBC_00424]MCX5078472.1 polymorphic toxin-type HINT domain-containing protein [Streptomyces sp. NBC_00424]
MAILIALVMTLVIDLRSATATAADEPVRYSRADVLQAWKFGGAEVKRAAEAALLGSDAEIQTFMAQELRKREDGDLRVQVAEFMAKGGPGVRAAANTALGGTSEQLQSFMGNGFVTAYEEDLRVDVGRVLAFGGPGVQRAANTALNGTPDAQIDFLQKGQFRAREDDNRVRVGRLLATGGPNIKLMANQALDGTPEEIQEFLDHGWEVAAARDQEALTVAQLAELADKAQKQASELTETAKEEAAKAEKAASAAKDAALLAAKEANESKDSAVKAAAAASRAAAAADRAAQAARTAVSAAAAANATARVAATAAAQAAYAAGRAGRAASAAHSAASAAAGDAGKAKKAREAAEEANAAASGANKAADAADQAGIASDRAADAARAASNAGKNAAAAAAAAVSAGNWAGEAGGKAEEAKAAAARAQRLADQATRAADVAGANAREAGTAARQSRDAARDAARHAAAAAAAANKAADEAGKAADAAAAATTAANAATDAANKALEAAGKAATVIDAARKADTERLEQQQGEEVLKAEESKRAYDARVATAAYEVGRLQQLNTQTKRLLDEAAAASDPKVTALKGRQAAVNMLGTGGVWVRYTAEVALSGSDADVVQFVRGGLTTALEQDDRASVSHIAVSSAIVAQRQAAVNVLDKPIAQVREFLRTRDYPGKAQDDRIAIAKVSGAGGAGVKAAASKALDGSAADMAQFLETGQYKAREDDDRVAIGKALATGGPEVKAAAQAALTGPPDGLRTFLEVGLHRAAQRDANAAAHIAQVNGLLQSAYKSAQLALKDASDAQKAAADARKDSQKAGEWADKAKASAGEAAKYAQQADASADAAADSSRRANESAKTARNAAASAQQAAKSAARSAAQAQHSATVASGYAAKARTSAAQAKASAEAAGKDSEQAAKASEAAMKTAADLLVAELKAQIQEEAKQSPEVSKPLTDQELQIALEKRLTKYKWNALSNGELKPGETLLVCGGDGAGGMGCITSTYLDRLITWYVGAEEIEACLQGKSMSCLDDLALHALRLKMIKKSPCNSFVPGTPVLMADRRSKAIEDIRVGDRVLATDPVSGRTKAEPVEATIVGQGTKNLVKIGIGGSGTDSKGSVTATDGHPFWIAGADNTWKTAADVKVGMPLLTATGEKVPVNSTRAWTVPEQRVYNLTVADIHTYYVLAGRTPVLVHNTNDKCGDLGEAWKQAKTQNICGSTGCEDVARQIQSQIGGTRFRITDSMNAPSLGKYRGEDTRWSHHDVVIRDGRVYDGWTDRYGEPLDVYKSHFEYGEYLRFDPLD